MQNSRLWFSTTLVSISWLGFGLLHSGGFPWSRRAPQIEVRTVPPGAEVLIDGKPVGLSDSFLDLPPDPGRSQIEVVVKKQGFEDARTRLEAGGFDMPLVFFALKPKLSKLQIAANTAKGLEVWSGPGVPVKLSEAWAWNLEPGLYELWGVRDGRSSERRLVRLKSGQVQEVNFSWTSPVSGSAEKP